MTNTTWPDDGPPHAPVARPLMTAASLSLGALAVMIAISLLRAAGRGAMLLPLLAFGSCVATPAAPRHVGPPPGYVYPQENHPKEWEATQTEDAAPAPPDQISPSAVVASAEPHPSTSPLKLLGAPDDAPDAAPAPSTKAALTPQPDPPKAPVAQTAEDGFDIRFVTTDLDNPIRLLCDSTQEVIGKTVTGRSDSGYLLKVDDAAVLNLHVGANIFYIPQGGTHSDLIVFGGRPHDLVGQMYLRLLGKEYGTTTTASGQTLFEYDEPRMGRLFKLHGAAAELSFGSSNVDVMTVARVDEHCDQIVFRATGSARLIVCFDGEDVARIPFEVRTSPVRVGMTIEEVVKHLGFPDSDDSAYGTWPYGTFLNRETAKEDARKGTVRIRHLRYAKFPELVISLDDLDRVVGWHSNTVHYRLP